MSRSLLTALLALRSNERLVLVAEQPKVAAIPWEYLRDLNNTLLASRLNLVRCVPEGQRRGQVSLKGPLKIVAVPVSPVDESRVLNTEREWRRLVETVTGKTPEEAPGKVLTLTRVRPPTLAQMEQTLPGQGITMVHFMGHSRTNKGKSVLINPAPTIIVSFFPKYHIHYTSLNGIAPVGGRPSVIPDLAAALF